MNFTPNEKQKKVIENTDGIYLVDAGAGTGKTFTITRRYLKLLERDSLSPEDLLLITFTNNAADQMKEKIIEGSDYGAARLDEAPIGTFHSYARRLVSNYGLDVPGLLGIPEEVSTSCRIVEGEYEEESLFDRFYRDFRSKNPGYEEFYRVFGGSENLLSTTKSLAARGVVPKEESWYGNGRELLRGDFSRFRERVEAANEPREGKRGPKQSSLRSKLRGFLGNGCFLDDAPSPEELGTSRGSKTVNEDLLKRAFNEDRGRLFNFVRELYWSYLEYCLSKNYLNFSFWMVLSYVLLREREDVRERVRARHVMIDEFQDTNEVQLKIAMLLAEEGNLCVVGDWKQSIFGFRYADVENILRFQERLKEYKEELNGGEERIAYSVADLESIALRKNYRSTQKLTDFSANALVVKGKRGEELREEEIRGKITELTSISDRSGTLEGMVSGDERAAILEKIGKIVGNDEYLIEENSEMSDKPEETNPRAKLREIEYGDIAVLSRTAKFGLKLQEEADDLGIPASFEAGVRIFSKKPGILLLAWLRILVDGNSRRGWAVVLEEAGYGIEQINYILENRAYPENMMEFKKNLETMEKVSALARVVFEKYGLRDNYTENIIRIVEESFSGSFMDLSGLVSFIEERISGEDTYEVQKLPKNEASRGSVTIQTIHAAKGLEYPVVFVSDINRRRFPSLKSNYKRVYFDKTLGLRRDKIYSSEEGYVFDNWRSKLVKRCLPSTDYDEERRLLHVAMTRAEEYLFLTAEKNEESRFFRELKKKGNLKVAEVESPEPKREEGAEEKREPVSADVPSGKSRLKLKATSLIREAGDLRGRGKELGSAVHRFARQWVEGSGKGKRSLEDFPIEGASEDLANLKDFLEDQEGKKIAEKPCLLPLGSEEGNEETFVLSGKIDLIVENGRKVKIFDYKTLKDEKLREPYRKQISVYHNAVKDVYGTGKESFDISSFIYYTREGLLVEVDPLGKKELLDEVKRLLGTADYGEDRTEEPLI